MYFNELSIFSSAKVPPNSRSCPALPPPALLIYAEIPVFFSFFSFFLSISAPDALDKSAFCGLMKDGAGNAEFPGGGSWTRKTAKPLNRSSFFNFMELKFSDRQNDSRSYSRSDGLYRAGNDPSPFASPAREDHGTDDALGRKSSCLAGPSPVDGTS